MKRNKNLTVLPPLNHAIPKSMPTSTRNGVSHSKYLSSNSPMTGFKGLTSSRSIERLSPAVLNKKIELVEENFDIKPETNSIFTPVYFKIKKPLGLPSLPDNMGESQLPSILKGLEETLDNIRENLVQASIIGALPTQKDLIESRNEISHCCIDVFNRIKNVTAKNMLSQEFVMYYQKQLQPLLKAYHKHKDLCVQVIKAHEEMKLLAESKGKGNHKDLEGDHSITARNLTQKILREHQALSLAADQCKLQLKILKPPQQKTKAVGSTNSNLKRQWEPLVKRATEFYESSYQEVESLLVGAYAQMGKLSEDVKAEMKDLAIYYNRFARVGRFLVQMLEVQTQKQELEDQLNKLEDLYFSLFTIEMKKASKSPQLSTLKSLSKTNGSSVILEIQNLKNKVQKIQEALEFETKETDKSEDMALIANQYLGFRLKISQDLFNLSNRISRAKEYEPCIIKLIELGNDLETAVSVRKEFENQIPSLRSPELEEDIQNQEQMKIEFIEAIYSDIFDPLAQYLMLIQKFPRPGQLVSLNYSFERYLIGEIFKCELMIDQVCSKSHKQLGEFYRKWRELLTQANSKYPNLLEEETNFINLHKDLTKMCDLAEARANEDSFEPKFLLLIEKSSEKLLDLCQSVRPLFVILTDKSRLIFPIHEIEETKIQEIHDAVLKSKEEAYFDYEVKSIAERQLDFIKDVQAFNVCFKKIRSSLTPELLQQKQMSAEFGQHSEKLLEAYSNLKRTYNNHSPYLPRIDKMYEKLSKTLESVAQVHALFTNDNYVIDEELLSGLGVLCHKDDLPSFEPIASQLSQIKKVLKIFLETSKVAENTMLFWKKRHLIGLEKPKMVLANQVDLSSEIGSITSIFPGVESRYQIYLSERAFLKYYVTLQLLKEEWHNLGERTDSLVKENRSVIKEQMDLVDELGKITDLIREEFSGDKQKKLSDLQVMYLSHLKGLLRSQAIEMKGHLELKAIGKGHPAKEAIQILCKPESATKIFEKFTKKRCIRTGPENKAINSPQGFEFGLSGRIIYKMARNCFICPASIELPSLNVKLEETILISNKGKNIKANILV